MEEPLELSIVATTYKDPAVLELLIEEIEKNVRPLGIDYEIIIVNDCSPDSTDQILEKICNANKSVKGVTLSHNYGQQIAMSVGVIHAKGKYVLLMDGDLQNPPDKIPELYAEILKGFDIVYTVSYERNNIFNKFSSWLFWIFLTKILKVRIVKNQLMLRIMTSKVVDRFKMYKEYTRSIAGIMHDIGLNSTVIKVTNRKRIKGKSNYNFFSRMNLMLDLVVSISNTPLNFLIHFGLSIFAVTFILILYNLYTYVFSNTPIGYFSIILLISLFGSLTLIILGILGKYLANIYTEVKNRPLFHISKNYNI
jgi:polyisoprenyl-phosphate glycosyltransferase